MKNQKGKSISAEALAEYIPYGKENAISRKHLLSITGLGSDRFLRRMIAQARKEGSFICNAQNGDGYYRSDDLDEIEAQYKQDRARALSILARCKYARRFLKANGREV